MSNLDKTLATKKFQQTYLCEDESKYARYYGDAVKAIVDKLDNWKHARAQLDMDWEECWAHYMSNWRGNQVIKRQTVLSIGDVSNEYRHDIPSSKAFEIVETVNSYLQDAFFPTKNWFDLEPKEPMDDEDFETTLKVLSRFIQIKLDEGSFTDYWDSFIRQMCIVGTSVLALPWCYSAKDSYKNEMTATGGVKAVPYTKVERNGFDFSVVDMFDFYLDPSASESAKSDVIRRLVKTKGEVLRMIDAGQFPLGDAKSILDCEVSTHGATSSASQQKQTLKYINGLSEDPERQEIELFEFWGNIVIGNVEYIDVHAICSQNTLLVFEPNPYWGGRPFIIGTLINGHNTPYGRGLLDPIKGQLHQMYVTNNQRLDINEIQVNPMWMVASDGSINPSDVFSQPGKVYEVEDPETSIVPIQMNISDVSFNIQDINILIDSINKTTGVGDYVGVNQGRDAERVTAREVEARQNAGGNRLGRYHKHIESTALKEFLSKAYQYLKQFITEDTTVKLQEPLSESVTDKYSYYSVGIKELQSELDIYPIGADHVIDKEFELRQHIDFYTFVQSSPQLAQFVNWKEVIKDLAKRLIKGDWTKYVVLPKEQDSPGADAATGQSPIDMMSQVMGGQAGSPQGMPQGQGMIPQMPPEMMGQGQQPTIPEVDTQQPSYDSKQIQALLASNPELVQKLSQDYTRSNQLLK